MFIDVSEVLLPPSSGRSETSVKFYQTTGRNNPEDSHLHTRRRENLKHTQNVLNLKQHSCQV
jgi:hypothetical protein